MKLAEREGPAEGEDDKVFKLPIAAVLERADKHHTFGTQSGNAGRILAMLDLAPRLRVHQREFDADPFLLNVQNGTLELGAAGGYDAPTQIRLRGHDRRDRLTRICNVEYRPESTACPEWTAALDYFCRTGSAPAG